MDETDAAAVSNLIAEIHYSSALSKTTVSTVWGFRCRYTYWAPKLSVKVKEKVIQKSSAIQSNFKYNACKFVYIYFRSKTALLHIS